MAKFTIATGIDGGDPFAGITIGAIEGVLDQFAQRALREFQSHGQEYTGGINPGIDDEGPESRLIGTDDQRAFFVNEGTSDHFISPRSGGQLAFQTTYVLKTSQGQIPSVPGGPSGNFAYSKGHMVSGIPARNVQDLIADVIADDFEKAILKAIGL